MYKRLLVPVDGSEISLRAMNESLELAAALGATVIGFVVEAMPPMPSSGAALANYEREVTEHELRTDGHAYRVLSKFAELASEKKVSFESQHDRDDDIAGAIAKAAQSKDADLIIMVTHGRGTFGELLFGSQTKNVMSRTKTPLLVLH
ncbi:MAG: universal stress protein [Rubrivivax sp.]|nr:universal stress protein [Rubrivivax sp.]